MEKYHNSEEGSYFHTFKSYSFNILKPRQNGHHFPDGIFRCIFINENVWTLIKISLMFAP